MDVNFLINAIALKHQDYGIDVYPPATTSEIADFEKQTGFNLPTDFKEFYLTCNGFSCTEDIFNIVPLSTIREYPQNYGDNWFYFSEYMIYSDMWGLRYSSARKYEIFNGSFPEKVLTTSLFDFLKRFLNGNVFESGGLYDWYGANGKNPKR